VTFSVKFVQEKPMRKSHFTKNQIVKILKEKEARMRFLNYALQSEISKNTYYKWKQKDGGMELSDIKTMREC